jgi:hypothetical protein
VAFADGGDPPAGSGPLLPFVVAQPARCQLLFVGLNPVTDPSFDVTPQTYSGGWDLGGDGSPGGCSVYPAAAPDPAPVPETVAVPVTAPVAATTPAPVAASGGTGLARTGRASDRWAVLGALAIVVGLGAIVGARPRHARLRAGPPPE